MEADGNDGNDGSIRGLGVCRMTESYSGGGSKGQGSDYPITAISRPSLFYRIKALRCKANAVAALAFIGVFIFLWHIRFGSGMLAIVFLLAVINGGIFWVWNFTGD